MFVFYLELPHIYIHLEYLASGALSGGRVHKDTPILECAVHISHHGSNITSTQGRLSLRWELALFHVLRDRLIPVLGISLVDGEDFPSGGNFHVGVCENELSNGL